MNLVLLLVITSSLFSNVRGFSARASTPFSICTMARPKTITTTKLHSSPDDKQAEIAALEEKLRQLKEETQSDPTEVVTIPESSEFDMELEEGDESMMFTERWKETEESQEESGLGTIVKVVLGIGFVIFLGFFSQVPVGEEDLQRYQAVKGDSSRIDLGDLNPGARVQ